MGSEELFIGLMSGTSLDGVDAVLMEFSGDRFRQVAQRMVPYEESLRDEILALHEPRAGELHESMLLANRLSQMCAESVQLLIEASGVEARRVLAIGCHGQTVRHRPEFGYTIQLGNGALLAELTGITVICDFRSRDIAAGGEGAPLVPAFHRAAFSHPREHRVIVNVGGIANLTDLPPGGSVGGFDTGPGNLLMDAWVQRHLGKPYDESGAWAASGKPIGPLLDQLLAHEFFSRRPPKSTGRDIFNLDWIESQLSAGHRPEDVQATLAALTAETIAGGIRLHCTGVQRIWLCGGGAHNTTLLGRLADLLPGQSVGTTDDLGIGVDWVEACAFAWLARQTLAGQPGNLPAVTGARGPRILGAIHHA
jgi:anhydro-N-acetylmuramic acid kinase